MALTMLPHRAYRRLPGRSGLAAGLSAMPLIAAVALLVWRLGDLTAVVGNLAGALSGFKPASTPAEFLGADLPLLDFRVAAVDYVDLVTWLVGSAFVLVLAGTRRRAPLRLFIQWLALLCLAASAWHLAVGEPPYGSRDFSVLYLSSSAAIWVVTAVLMAVLAVIFPFTMVERLLLVAVCVAYDVVLCAVRYALAAILLDALGPVPMAALFLLLGPLMDFVVLIGLFALFVVRAGERIDRSVERRGWAWL